MSPLALIRPWMAYGLYASRTRAKWLEIKYVVRLAPQGWKEKYFNNSDVEEKTPPETTECSVSEKQKNLHGLD